MIQAPLRIIQISDSHLFADTNKTLLGVNTHSSFKAVIDFLRSQPEKFDCIIHSGDLSQDGSPSSYLRLADMFKEFNVPVYFVPGNHDNVGELEKTYPYGPMVMDKHLLHDTWQIILLNSQIPGKVEGFLDEAQLQYLEYCLTTYPNHHAMLVLHHQPVPVGSQWLDNLGLTNADIFWKIIAKYPKVNTILFGHVHQEHEQMMNGKIKCYSVPSTCIQFHRQQDKFGLQKLPPGFRWINLYKDGRIETSVKRLAEYIGVFEVDAKGY